MSSPPRADPLQAWVRARIEAGDFPGAAWCVERDGERLARGAAGYARRLPTPRRLAVETPFDLASLTKPLATALLAVLLEQDGALRLDAPVSSLLPELAASPYAQRSLSELGSHTAGLPAWDPLYLSSERLAGMLERIATLEPAGRPGQVLYSDLGYLLLGIALERAAGRTLDVLFGERVAAPLALRRTGFARRRPFPQAAATEQGNVYERALAGPAGEGYCWRCAVIEGRVHDGNAFAMGGVAGHAGLFGTVDEVALLGREIMAPARLSLSPSAREHLLVAQRPGGTRSFGFCLARGSDAARGVLPAQAVGHVGFTGTSLWLDPDGGRLYVLLTNRVHPRVGTRDFQAVRREFHRRAAAL